MLEAAGLRLLTLMESAGGGAGCARASTPLPILVSSSCSGHLLTARGCTTPCTAPTVNQAVRTRAKHAA